MKRIYLEGEACNRRLLEMTKIRRYFEVNDYEIVSKPDGADLIFFCTCAFKEKEENYSVERLRKLRAFGTEMFVYGCLPSIAPEKYDEFADIKNIAPKNLEKIDDYFNDIKCKFNEVPDYNVIKENNTLAYKIKRNYKTNDLFTQEFLSRSLKSAKGFIKLNKDESKKEYILLVSKGCQGRCSYCAIKYAIGPVVSKPLDKVLSELREGVNNGFGKFIILGDDPGCYGLDIGLTLPAMIGQVSDEINRLVESKEDPQKTLPSIELHLNEIHPKHLIKYGDDLLQAIDDKKLKSILCPVQSGSNRILKLMEREHTIEEYRETLNRIRERNPETKLYTHIIVGFPTETDEEFHETLAAVKEIGFDYVVVFPYHEKKHTPAADLTEKLDHLMIQDRTKKAFRYFKRQGIKAYSRCP